MLISIETHDVLFTAHCRSSLLYINQYFNFWNSKKKWNLKKNWNFLKKKLLQSLWKLFFWILHQKTIKKHILYLSLWSKMKKLCSISPRLRAARGPVRPGPLGAWRCGPIDLKFFWWLWALFVPLKSYEIRFYWIKPNSWTP